MMLTGINNSHPFSQCWSHRCSMTSSHTMLPTAGPNCSLPFVVVVLVLVMPLSTAGRLPILRHWMTSLNQVQVQSSFRSLSVYQLAMQRAVLYFYQHVSRRLAYPPSSYCCWLRSFLYIRSIYMLFGVCVSDFTLWRPKINKWVNGSPSSLSYSQESETERECVVVAPHLGE